MPTIRYRSAAESDYSRHEAHNHAQAAARRAAWLYGVDKRQNAYPVRKAAIGACSSCGRQRMALQDGMCLDCGKAKGE